MQLEGPEIGKVALERRLCRYAFCFALRLHATIVDAVRKARQPPSFSSIPPHQFALAQALKIANGAHAITGQSLLRDLSHAEDPRDRFRCEERARLLAPEHGKAAWLVQIGGDLGEKLIA